MLSPHAVTGFFVAIIGGVSDSYGKGRRPNEARVPILMRRVDASGVSVRPSKGIEMNVPTASNLLSLSIDEMISYYAAPVPIPPTVQPSTNPDVYMNDPNYMKGLNKQFFESYAVQVPNTQAFDTYRTALQNWAIMRTGPLPTPPSYVKLDDAGFNAWWAAYCMAYGAGKDAPPVNFIIPVAPLPPAPEIVAPVVPTSGSPIGAADGASIFMSR